jgi:hypothetical protein
MAQIPVRAGRGSDRRSGSGASITSLLSKHFVAESPRGDVFAPGEVAARCERRTIGMQAHHGLGAGRRSALRLWARVGLDWGSGPSHHAATPSVGPQHQARTQSTLQPPGILERGFTRHNEKDPPRFLRGTRPRLLSSRPGAFTPPPPPPPPPERDGIPEEVHSPTLFFSFQTTVRCRRTTATTRCTSHQPSRKAQIIDLKITDLP